MTTTLADDRR